MIPSEKSRCLFGKMVKVPSLCTLKRFVVSAILTDANCASYSTPNEPLTYLSLSDLMGNQTDSILSDLKANMTAARDAMTWADETVRAGFEAVFNLEADVLLPSKVGAVEFLQANLGYGSGDQGITFTFQAAAQHTVSQGYVHITSASVWDCQHMPCLSDIPQSDWLFPFRS